ncbi:hypothetical protein RJ40_03160 [Methanofollis aquaemaris]|uniref:Uncharacterized protein n=1 Tax=Methanofollis aquaemaris TaxID=126734 RepID=A0A8A3S4K7_9EURY|nr:hypothetical protein [Methanofollis aquaemaris]QSZ66566.1 hypothetical protein RJ40_03160 [Methanofollis aquaemaris]
MEFRTRVVVAFALLVAIAATALAVQISAEGLYGPETGREPPVSSDMTFSRADFLYGPQDWRPYLTPLSLNTLPATGEDEQWYFMLVRLNETPQGGNPALYTLRSVAVDYDFKDLSGTAAFYLYGKRAGSGRTWTSRQEGYGASGLLVTGTAAPGRGMPQASPFKHTGEWVEMRLANTHGLGPDEIPTATVAFWFPQNKVGQDALHITTDPAQRKGQVTTDAAPSGRFFITHTGGSQVGAVYLLVAVDRPQPDTFSLRLMTEAV